MADENQAGLKNGGMPEKKELTSLEADLTCSQKLGLGPRRDNVKKDT